MRTLTELYLSIFVLFFRISRWKGRMRSGMAAICVSAVVICIAVTFWAWIQTATHHYVELNNWVVAGTAVAIFVVNHYFLRGRGGEFEKQFRSFSKSKRIALYLAAVSVLVVTGTAFAIIVEDYQQTFHLPRK